MWGGGGGEKVCISTFIYNVCKIRPLFLSRIYVFFEASVVICFCVVFSLIFMNIFLICYLVRC